MNIAHLLPYSAQFPLTTHNGRYEWVLRLARLQVKAGHTVTIYAAPNSFDEDHPHLRWRSLAQSLGGKQQNNNALMATAFSEPSHDILHSHFDSLHYDLAHLTKKPIVATQHWSPNSTIAKVATAKASLDNCTTIAPTDYIYQEDLRLNIPVRCVTNHGIDLNLFRPVRSPENLRLLFAGRITKNKGVHEAIEIARRHKLPLDIVGKVSPIDTDYWNSIKPSHNDKYIRYLGVKDQKDTARLMANALAVIFPAITAEAFGQVTIEAQASGTPIIIDERTKSFDLVDDGRSGFIAHTPADYILAINKLDTIDRSYCRKFAESFDVNHMAQQYEDLYAKLLS